MTNNLRKMFGDIVSVDAWRTSFDEDGRASVHVDLSFLTGHVGGEDHFAVTFTVSLKRAVVKIIIPETENIAVIQSSVDREPTLEGIKKVIKESQIGHAGSAAVDARFRAPLSVTARGEAEITTAGSKKTKTEYNSKISEFQIRQLVDGAKNYGWEITSSENGVLDGKVWDPVRRLRLSVKKIAESKIEPSMQVCVYCRMGDISIDNIKIKGKTAFSNRFTPNRAAAAKAVIRQKLLENGLTSPEGDNELVEVKIADCLVYPEVL